MSLVRPITTSIATSTKPTTLARSITAQGHGLAPQFLDQAPKDVTAVER